jgi:AcrR family transcriptional regulator
MSARTVDWTATGEPQGGATRPEGLRERKKRLMRQQLSDTATEMFVERGFDAVRVAEVAEACGVSEKTVFNYFPTKESLVLDRFDVTMASLRTGLAEPGVGPVQATLRILAGELEAMASWLEAQEDLVGTLAKVQRFDALILSTPALRAYQLIEQDKLIDAAAEVIAERAGISPEEPEPRIAAAALIALWDIHFRSLAKHLARVRTSADLRKVRPAVTADVRRAAQLLETGLGTFTGASVP